MTATTTVARSLTPTRHNRFVRTLLDIGAVTARNLTTYRRVPQLLVFSTIQPVLLVLLFRYVFGGAIHIPGVDYVDYLMPGVFVQTVLFGSLSTGIGLATDLQSGLIERFRSLPMARSAVLAGRTLADSTRNVFVLILMCLVGYAVGWRPDTGVLSFFGGMVLLLLFGYAMSWVFATLGLLVSDPESAQAATFPVMAPLVFASSAFVSVETMPSWLQGFARNQPLSVVVTAVRDLTIGGAQSPGSTSHNVLAAVAWCVGIVAVAAPISVRVYRRRNLR
jgi:ABC-2 type transport system permease protein/oleandomycin transport system permease protein